MAFHIKDPATDAAVRRLARLKGTTLTEAVREAVEQAYAKEMEQIPMLDESAKSRTKLLRVPSLAGCPRTRHSMIGCPATNDISRCVGNRGRARAGA